MENIVVEKVARGIDHYKSTRSETPFGTWRDAKSLGAGYSNYLGRKATTINGPGTKNKTTTKPVELWMRNGHSTLALFFQILFHPPHVVQISSDKKRLQNPPDEKNVAKTSLCPSFSVSVCFV